MPTTRLDQIKLVTGKRILRSGMALGFLEGRITSGLSDRPADRAVAYFAIDLLKKLYAASNSKIVWTNAFFPSELLWGLGTVPFFPEIGAVVGTGIGFSEDALERAAADAYPVDLCTFHRAAAGLALEQVFPRADAFVSTSHLCDVSGQNLANHAYIAQRPFFFVDVPTTTDDEAVTYVEKQLEATAHSLSEALGLRYDVERIREAVHLSNLAWDAVQEQQALRAARPAPLRGSDMLAQLGLTVMVFGTPCGVDYHQALRDYVRERVTTRTPEQANQKVRLYWMHLRPSSSTDFMSHLEDDLGAVIAFEELSSIWWDRLDEEQPFRALAQKMLANFALGPVERRIDQALANISRYECDGVVHFNHWGCRQSTGSLRILQDCLKREGIPFLAIDGDCIDAANLQIGPLRTRVEAFVETLVG